MFEEVKIYRNGHPNEVPTFPVEGDTWVAQVSTDLLSGYAVRLIPESDGHPPITAAQRCYSSCQFGDVKPTKILSSEAIAKRVLKCIIPAHRRKVEGGNGFWFN